MRTSTVRPVRPARRELSLGALLALSFGAAALLVFVALWLLGVAIGHARVAAVPAVPAATPGPVVSAPVAPGQRIEEDDPRWNCARDGNGSCGQLYWT